jgi:hypothetical protein
MGLEEEIERIKNGRSARRSTSMENSVALLGNT